MKSNIYTGSAPPFESYSL